MALLSHTRIWTQLLPQVPTAIILLQRSGNPKSFTVRKFIFSPLVEFWIQAPQHSGQLRLTRISDISPESGIISFKFFFTVYRLSSLAIAPLKVSSCQGSFKGTNAEGCPRPKHHSLLSSICTVWPTSLRKTWWKGHTAHLSDNMQSAMHRSFVFHF